MLRSLPPRRPAFVLISVLLLGLAARGASQGLTLVKDINSGPKISPPSYPYLFTQVGSDVFFRARTPALGDELFRSGGTAATTTLVKDVYPGPLSGNARAFTPLGNLLLFTAQIPSTMAYVLCRSDGTQSGTTVVASSPGDPRYLTKLGTAVLFSGHTAANGIELWRSDGTTNGTTLVKDVNPGTASAGIVVLGLFNGAVYFSADDGQSGIELWRSDGTAAGTQLALDLVPGSGRSTPSVFGAFGSFFLLRTESPTAALWKSDGTPAGTTLLKRFTSQQPLPGCGQPFVQLGSKVYFSANDARGTELWETDGTVAGTRLVKDIDPGSQSSSPGCFTRVGSSIFFAAGDAQSGLELWKTDGTSLGTVLVKDIVAGAGGSGPEQLVSFNNTLYFTAKDHRGREFWRSDGTAAGTVIVRDFHPNPAVNSVWSLTVQANRLWLAADDGTLGQEPWVSDGTSAGTVPVKDVNPALPGTDGSDPRDVVDFYGIALFFAKDVNTGTELWRTNGTTAGTRLVKDTEPGAGLSVPYHLTVAGGQAFFVKAPSPNTLADSLWRTDGTSAGTRLLRTFNAKNGVGAPIAIGDHVLFFAEEPATGRELWKSDGTAAGTVLVKDILAGSGGSGPSWMTAVGSTLFFQANDGTNGFELWKSDGTAAGTVLVKDINPRGGSGPSWLAAYKGAVYFAADDGTNGVELWRSDGTAAGTVMVKNIYPFGSSSPGALVAGGGLLFFSAYAGTPNLWVSDGTSAGTRAVPVTVLPGNRMTSFQNGVMFQGRGAGTTGREPWRSDGTAAGTYMLKDIEPGAGNSGASSIVASGSRFAWFSAYSQAAGTELYGTDGTMNGTRMVADLQPGANSSFPDDLVVSGGRLLFSADGGTQGAELWKLDLPASAIRVGRGCGAPVRSRPLDLTDPILGRVATLSGDEAPLGVSAYVVLSAGYAPPFKLAPKCLVYLNPATMTIIAAFVTTKSNWQLGLSVPGDVRLIGLPVALQTLYAPTSAPAGFDLTNAVHAWLGP